MKKWIVFVSFSVAKAFLQFEFSIDELMTKGDPKAVRIFLKHYEINDTSISAVSAMLRQPPLSRHYGFSETADRITALKRYMDIPALHKTVFSPSFIIENSLFPRRYTGNLLSGQWRLSKDLILYALQRPWQINSIWWAAVLGPRQEMVPEQLAEVIKSRPRGDLSFLIEYVSSGDKSLKYMVATIAASNSFSAIPDYLINFIALLAEELGIEEFEPEELLNKLVSEPGRSGLVYWSVVANLMTVDASWTCTEDIKGLLQKVDYTNFYGFTFKALLRHCPNHIPADLPREYWPTRLLSVEERFDLWQSDSPFTMEEGIPCFSGSGELLKYFRKSGRRGKYPLNIQTCDGIGITMIVEYVITTSLNEIQERSKTMHRTIIGMMPIALKYRSKINWQGFLNYNTWDDFGKQMVNIGVYSAQKMQLILENQKIKEYLTPREFAQLTEKA